MLTLCAKTSSKDELEFFNTLTYWELAIFFWEPRVPRINIPSSYSLEFMIDTSCVVEFEILSDICKISECSKIVCSLKILEKSYER